MEIFPSADDEQWDFIKREIESSDYYLVVVAGKYGSLGGDSISFTEMEYDFAVSMKKPVMGFLFHDLGELKGSLLEQDTEKRLKLDAFRQKVARGRLIKYYRNPDELKACVFQALAHSFQFRPAEGWVRALNARRMEDLEQIDALRQRITALEKENAALKRTAAARAELQGGDDPVQWTVKVIEWKVSPEADASRLGVSGFRWDKGDFVLRSTWNRLFKDFFEGVGSFASSGTLDENFKRAIRSSGPGDGVISAASFGDNREAWMKCRSEAGLMQQEGAPVRLENDTVIIPLIPVDISDDERRRIGQEVQFQFRALGLIEVDIEHDGWALTQPGIMELARLRGKLKETRGSAAAQPVEPPNADIAFTAGEES
jgi:hypothetical protein